MLWFVLIVIVVFVIASQADEFKTQRGGKQVRARERRLTVGASRGWDTPELTDSEHFGESRRAWVPPGRAIEIAGVTVGGGMIYVGESLHAIERWVGVEPALINPTLDVRLPAEGGSGADLGYWPSYNEIGNLARGHYLTWLAAGRRDPAIPLGYVFIFFYGLERRVLFDLRHDPSVRSELPSIQRELKELLEVYGHENSFSSYGGRLLGIVRALGGKLDPDAAKPPTGHRSHDLPLEIAMPIGVLVQRGTPVPARWAYSWVSSSYSIGFRTPAERCPEEFRALFLIRYREKYGEGLKINEPKTRLKLDYRPASRSLGRRLPEGELDVPDIRALSSPQRQLQALVDQVQDELDSYSRYVGRHDDRTSVAAQALLPAELVGIREDEDTDALLTLLRSAVAGDEHIGAVPVAELIELFPTKQPGKLYKNEARSLCELVGKMGFGIEPDASRGGQNLGQSEIAMVYRLPSRDSKDVEWSDAAALMMRLGSVVAASDDGISEEEERALESHLEAALSLDDGQRLRFRAHLRWSLTHPPSMRGVRRKTESLSADGRAKVTHAVLAIAGADGRIDPTEMKSLAKIYDVLGLSEERLFKDVHELAFSNADGGPVTLAKGDATADFAIPGPPEPSRPTEHPGEIRLDPEKVERIAQDSRAASELLAAVFQDEDQEEDELPEDTAVGMLDTSHRDVFREVIERPQWSEEDLAALIERHGLFFSGAIEVLNEASFETCGEPLFERGEGWEINQFAVQEMKS